jgi:hypothetical protein
MVPQSTPKTTRTMNTNSDTGLPSPIDTSDEKAQEYVWQHEIASHFTDGTLLDRGDPEAFLHDLVGFGYPVVGPESPAACMMEVLIGAADQSTLHPAHRERAPPTTFTPP